MSVFRFLFRCRRCGYRSGAARAEGGFVDYDVPRQREPDRARRRHAHPAPPRSDARLSLRVPRRHVRVVRDERQRRRALDLPHARRECREGRRARDRAARESAGDQGPRHRHARVLRQVGAGEGPIQGHEDASRRLRARRAGTRRSASRPTPASSASAAASATRRATSSAGARRFSVPRRSTARGRSSTTRATSRNASACAPLPAMPAATRATRRARAASAVRSASSRRPASPA